jgi:uncharacterized iron-regulated membrane protein
MSRATTETEQSATARRHRSGRLRRGAIKFHKWIALIVGAWIVLQAVSGSVLAFSDQIDAWSRPGLYHHGRGDVGPQAAAVHAASAVPNGVAVGVQMPSNETGVYVVTVSIRKPGVPRTSALPPQRLVYVDPADMHVNGVRNPTAGFTYWLGRLHGNLLQTKVLGVKGSIIVGWLGVTAIVVIITGAYLWLWPSIRKASTLFRLRRKSPMVFSLDTHRLIGIVVFPVLLLTLLTGVNLTFQKELRAVWYAITPGPDKGTRTAIIPPRSGRHDVTATRISLDLARDRAARVTGGRVDSISTPSTPTGTFAVRITRGWDPARGPRGRGGNITAYVDQYDGAVLRVVRPSDYPVPAQVYEYWATPVHFGTAGGIATRWLVDLTALGTLAMIGSGVRLTILRRRKKARRHEALSQALPALPIPILQDATQQSWTDKVAAGTTVVREGDPADAFYVILDGEFDVFEGKTLMRTLGPGASFGDIGLRWTGVRTASVEARTDGELVVVPTDEFEIILRRAERDGMDLSATGVAYAGEHGHSVRRT